MSSKRKASELKPAKKTAKNNPSEMEGAAKKPSARTRNQQEVADVEMTKDLSDPDLPSVSDEEVSKTVSANKKAKKGKAKKDAAKPSSPNGDGDSPQEDEPKLEEALPQGKPKKGRLNKKATKSPQSDEVSSHEGEPNTEQTSEIVAGDVKPKKGRPNRKTAKSPQSDDVSSHEGEPNTEQTSEMVTGDVKPKKGRPNRKTAKSPQSDDVSSHEGEPNTEQTSKMVSGVKNPKKGRPNKKTAKSPQSDDASSHDGEPNTEETSKVAPGDVKPKKGRPKKKVAKPSPSSTDDDSAQEEALKTEETLPEEKPKKGRGNKKPAKSQQSDDGSSKVVQASEKPKKGRPKKDSPKASSSSVSPEEGPETESPQPSQSADTSSDDFEKEKPKTKKPKLKDVKKTDSSSKPEAAAPKPPNRSILQLKIQMCDISPPIWRRIQVLNNDTFKNLSDYIREAMGWMGCHSHHFIAPDFKNKRNIMIVDGPRYDSSEKHLLNGETTKLSKFLNAKGDSLTYEYDLGDSWQHDVFVEKVLPPPPPKAEYPKCTGGKRACPPEDCGGVDGYNHLLEVYKDPNHEEYEELIGEWLADMKPGWDPEEFKKNKVFKKVRMWVYVGP